jgi:hypothetical protein
MPSHIERDFQPHDIVLVRTAEFMLLHQGRVKALPRANGHSIPGPFFGAYGHEQVAKHSWLRPRGPE